MRVWLDLADRLRLRLRTPQLVDGQPHLIALRFEPLDESARWRDHSPADPREKYGAKTRYQRISKLEDPDLLIDLDEALERLNLPREPRILDLGVNRGDSLAMILGLRPAWAKTLRFVGVDHSASALDLARARWAELGDRADFIEADLGALERLELGRFDLVLSIGTLHSPGVDHQVVLRHVVKNLLAPGAGVILGVPNCTHIDGEQLFGARTKNFTQPELSLLIKSVAHYKRYLQQHRRKVYVTGKYYVLVTGAAELEGERGG
ncbi:class I SAM-dependent methyltransferase [Pseudenhygromyxa sp. WMMC2535]|uniref:class I SAM-dependent methyltransferase n=1 Tax=Pseudenhygromyxa sp. WMMC2535 TaxID=2712867 RepID=UPI0020D1220D|nr:class I SAM-dependent methyltransferase [Pseudenhygromyxa sp. WMMC2535]